MRRDRRAERTADALDVITAVAIGKVVIRVAAA
jgi:hypothetical protein